MGFKLTLRSLLCFRQGIGQLCLDCRKLLTISKSSSFSGFSMLTKNSLNDRATVGIALLINNSYLFSEVHLNPPLQVVAARVVTRLSPSAVFILLHQITLQRSHCNRTTAISIHSFGQLQWPFPGLG